MKNAHRLSRTERPAQGLQSCHLPESSKSPESEELRQLGWQLADSGFGEQALECFRHAQVLDPGWETDIELARFLTHFHPPAEAIACWLSIRDQVRDAGLRALEREITHELLSLYLESHAVTEFQSLLPRAVRLSNTLAEEDGSGSLDPLTLYFRAVQAMQQREWDLAESLAKGIQSVSGRAGARATLLLADLKFRTGDPHAGHTLTDSVCVADEAGLLPEMIQAWEQKARMLVCEGRLQEAICALDIGLKRVCDQPRAARRSAKLKLLRTQFKRRQAVSRQNPELN